MDILSLGQPFPQEQLLRPVGLSGSANMDQILNLRISELIISDLPYDSLKISLNCSVRAAVTIFSIL
jgi:hypothetical protein